jgi:hypothetical protein
LLNAAALPRRPYNYSPASHLLHSKKTRYKIKRERIGCQFCRRRNQNPTTRKQPNEKNHGQKSLSPALSLSLSSVKQ